MMKMIEHWYTCCRYMTLKIVSGQAHHISCAAHGCARLLPATLIQAVVEPELASKYITAEIQVHYLVYALLYFTYRRFRLKMYNVVVSMWIIEL